MYLSQAETTRDGGLTVGSFLAWKKELKKVLKLDSDIFCKVDTGRIGQIMKVSLLYSY